MTTNNRVATSKLPALFRHLIKSLRSRSGKRFAPREVQVQFVPGNHVEINVAAFSFNAVTGEEISRKAPETWMGSDGEPNYTEMVTYRGPVVTHHGYSARDARVTVYLPTGLSDERDPATATDDNVFGALPPHYDAATRYTQMIASGDLTILSVLSDRAFEV